MVTRARLGLLGLLLGVLVGARTWRRRPAPPGPPDVANLERDAQRTRRVVQHELAALEARSRRRAALTVAMVPVGALPAIALATLPDVEPLAVALVVGGYALVALAALLVAARTPSRSRDG